MSPIARMMSPKDVQNVAAYYASLPIPQAPTQSAAREIASGADLAWRGDWSKELAPYRSCHGGEGLRVGKAFPPLVGQSAAYIEAALKAWKVVRDATTRRAS